MKQVSGRQRRRRHRPSHARAAGLTPLRSAVCLALFAGLAIVVGIAGQGGPAGVVAAHAAVPPQVTSPELPAISPPGSPVHSAQPVAGVAHPAVSTSASSSGTDLGLAGISDSWPASGLAADGIPLTALTAYEAAAAREAGINPNCGLSWPLLAGIGRVESDHGRFAGATLHADGLSTPPVIGIPLNGHGTALILDTDHGALDGDKVYDRAVGPMQFIPSTWASWGVDANGDGVKDPFNIFDAAAAAADYLCAAGRDLTTTRGQVQAILSYNWSWDYVSMVMSLEKIYASGAVGITVPVLPTSPDPQHGRPRHNPQLPPVDPGKPRGAGSGTTTGPTPTTSPTSPHPTSSDTSTSPSPHPSSSSGGSSSGGPSSGGSSSGGSSSGAPSSGGPSSGGPSSGGSSSGGSSSASSLATSPSDTPCPTGSVTSSGSGSQTPTATPTSCPDPSAGASSAAGSLSGPSGSDGSTSTGP